MLDTPSISEFSPIYWPYLSSGFLAVSVGPGLLWARASTPVNNQFPLTSLPLANLFTSLLPRSYHRTSGRSSHGCDRCALTCWWPTIVIGNPCALTFRKLSPTCPRCSEWTNISHAKSITTNSKIQSSRLQTSSHTRDRYVHVLQTYRPSTSDYPKKEHLLGSASFVPPQLRISPLTINSTPKSTPSRSYGNRKSSVLNKSIMSDTSALFSLMSQVILSSQT